MIQDPIADLLTRIRNAQHARLEATSAPSSKQKIAIVDVLEKEGFIKGYSVNDENPAKPVLNIELKYYKDAPVIRHIKRVSKPSLKKYFKNSELPVVLGGLGICVVTNSKGIMSDKEARRLGLGGEVICTVE